MFLVSLLIMKVISFCSIMLGFKSVKQKRFSVVFGLVFLFVLVIRCPLNAQQDPLLLTIDKAVAIALDKNGSIQVSHYEIEKQKALKSASITIEKTNFDFNYGQINTVENDFGFTVNQSFQFPTVYGKQSKLADAKVKNSELRLTISENELKKKVKSVWLHLAYLHEREELLLYQDSIYQRFNYASKIRYQTKEASFLEQANGEVQLMEIRLQLNQNKADINIYRNKLQTLLNVAYSVDVVATKDLEKRAIEIKSDTFQISDNPMLNYYLYQADLIEFEKSVQKAEYLPEFRLGYFNVSMVGYQDVDNTLKYFNSSDRFTGVAFGVDIPIWFKANTANVKATDLAQIKAQAEADYFEKQLLGEFNRVIQEYRKLKSGITYYEANGLPQAALILDNAQKSFERGAINYVEYIHSVDAVLVIQYNYLQMLNEYNQSVIAIEYFVGR